MSAVTTILTNPGFDHLECNIHHGEYLKRQKDAYFELASESQVGGWLCALVCSLMAIALVGGIIGLGVWLAR